MNAQIKKALISLCLISALLAGCAPAATPQPMQQVFEAPAATEAPAVIEEPDSNAESPKENPPSNQVIPTAVPIYKVESAPASQSDGADRLIVKNAEIELLVADTDVAIDRTTQIITDVDGYIISSRVWLITTQVGSEKYATITIGVPVDQFERALRRLREIAKKVLSENASGEDVTDEYVDLESRLRNLEASRDRIRQFMEDAKSVDEVLRINDQLTAVEEEIEKVQGRMNYLFDRAAYSTITIQIYPDIPPVVPTPTLTPTSTATPTATPIWSAAPVYRHASSALVEFSHMIVEAGIWIVILLIPIFGPIVIIGWLIWRFTRKKTVTKSPQEPQE